MSERNGPPEPPSFDAAFEEDVEQRIYGTVLQTREPTSASAIAERADCDPKTARKYLSWFAELGIVTKYNGRPTTYQRNDAYFEWRRVHDLASTHSLEELQEEVSRLTEAVAEYRDRYGVESPAAVDLLDVDADRVDDVHADLGAWATAERERRLFERARRQVADSTARSHG